MLRQLFDAPSCTCTYLIADPVSGDALLIRDCGRTDVQNGDPAQLDDSLQRLLSLPEAMLV